MKHSFRYTFLGLLLSTFSIIAAAQESRPVIGISSANASSVGINYVKSVRKAGGVPLIIPITTDEAEIAKVIETIDGLLMTGGEDVEPARYGEEPIPQLGKVNPERDEFDLALVRQAVSDDGIVEAIEKTGSECVIGVQFHPEGFVAEDNDSLLPLFRHLVISAAE